MYLNKAMLFGNLTRDPELRSLPSGMQVANFSLATNRVYKDKDGARQEQTDFHNVVVFGRQAETVSQYLKKGSSAYVEGRMQTRSWEQEGQKKYRTEVVAERVQFGPKGSSGGGAPQAADDSDGGGAPSKGGNDSSNDSGIDYPQDDINPDDIPF